MCNEQIDEWIEWEITELQRFVIWYKFMHEKDPDTFPLSLPKGEFDEQYRYWQ
jgi:hypothetical protein